MDRQIQHKCVQAFCCQGSQPGIVRIQYTRISHHPIWAQACGTSGTASLRGEVFPHCRHALSPRMSGWQAGMPSYRPGEPSSRRSINQQALIGPWSCSRRRSCTACSSAPSGAGTSYSCVPLWVLDARAQGCELSTAIPFSPDIWRQVSATKLTAQDEEQATMHALSCSWTRLLLRRPPTEWLSVWCCFTSPS